MIYLNYIIGFIGFGEAASIIVEGLRETKYTTRVFAFDINKNHETMGEEIRLRAEDLNVELLDSLEELVTRCKVIINLTSPKFALQTAKGIVNLLDSYHLYIDMNSTSPMIKKEIESTIGKSTLFVDAAVMESVPKYRHRVPILVSGEGAMQAVKFSDALGMNMRFISNESGKSSAIKMIRSIFMKGFTMLLIETLEASNKYNINEITIKSIGDSIQTIPLEELSNMLIGRSVLHANRRISEMNEVVHTLEEINVDSLMSKATRGKLKMLSDLNLKEHFNNKNQMSYFEILKELSTKKQVL